MASASLAMAEGLEVGDSVYVVFTNNNGGTSSTLTSSVATGSLTYNALVTSSSGSKTFTDIYDSTGANVSGLGLYASQPASGAAGAISSLAGTEASVVGGVFDIGLVERVINNTGGAVVGVNGLSAGSYTLTVLVGRGNNYAGTQRTNYTLTASSGTVSSLTASVLAYHTTSTAADALPTVSAEGVVGGYVAPGESNVANNWMLMSYSFDATEATDIRLSGVGAGGNFAALKLEKVSEAIPEPTTATLSLLALAGLAARRRRK